MDLRSMADKPKPSAGESPEAQWWFREITKAFEKTEAKPGKRERPAARRGRAEPKGHDSGTTPTTTIRLDRADIARARRLAGRRGLKYQTYLKMLIHEALDAEENTLK